MAREPPVWFTPVVVTLTHLKATGLLLKSRELSAALWAALYAE
jgi:hypothetical protein